MSNVWVAAVFLATILAAGQSVALSQQPSSKDQVKSAVHLTVQRNAQQATFGSGFLYKDKMHVMTCCHVVMDATSIQVQFSTGETRACTVMELDPAHDLALLTLDKAAPLTSRAVPENELAQIDFQPNLNAQVIGVGHSGGYLFSSIVFFVQRVWTVRQIDLPNKAALDQAMEIYQLSRGAAGGMSGAPVWDPQNGLIGVYFAGDVTTPHDFCISHENLRGLSFARTNPLQVKQFGAPDQSSMIKYQASGEIKLEREQGGAIIRGTVNLGTVAEDNAFTKFFAHPNNQGQHIDRENVRHVYRKYGKVYHLVNRTGDVGLLLPEGYVLDEDYNAEKKVYSCKIHRPETPYILHIYRQLDVTVPDEVPQRVQKFAGLVQSFRREELGIQRVLFPDNLPPLIPGRLQKDDGILASPFLEPMISPHGCVGILNQYDRPQMNMNQVDEYVFELCRRRGRFEAVGHRYPLEDNPERKIDIVKEMDFIEMSIYDPSIGIDRTKEEKFELPANPGF